MTERDAKRGVVWEAMKARLAKGTIRVPTNEELLEELRNPLPWSRGIRFFSSAWTGRDHNAGTPIDAIRRAWNAFLWPSYRCEDCEGSATHGCYCQAHGAIAPGVPPERWRVWLRKLPRRIRRWRNRHGTTTG